MSVPVRSNATAGAEARTEQLRERLVAHSQVYLGAIAEIDYLVKESGKHKRKCVTAETQLELANRKLEVLTSKRLLDLATIARLQEACARLREKLQVERQKNEQAMQFLRG